MTDSPTARLRELHLAIIEAAPGITSEEYRTFLLVAEREGCCQRDVQDELGIAQSSVSRTVANLNGSGHGIITASTDPESRRRNNLRLSDKGRELIARLSLMIGCFAFAHLALVAGYCITT